MENSDSVEAPYQGRYETGSRPHFQSGGALETTLHCYVVLDDQQLPQATLGSKTPLPAMKDWYKLKTELFRKKPYHLPGSDT